MLAVLTAQDETCLRKDRQSSWRVLHYLNVVGLAQPVSGPCEYSVTIVERGVQMTKATLRKYIVILLSAAVLSGGLNADAAYALGGGGFGAGHMGGSHVGSVGDGGIGGLGSGKMVAGFGRSHVGLAAGFSRERAGGLGAAL
jgi:hypothetical protein